MYFTRQALATVNRAACVTLTMRCLTAINQLVKRKVLTMAEYIERGTAIAKLTALEVTKSSATMTDAKRMLADMPAADVAPVVRCRDCKYYRVSTMLAPNKFCFRLKHPVEDRPIGYNFAPDDFCSYGERKEND